MRQLFLFAMLVVVAASGCSGGGSSSGKGKESPPPPCHPGCFPAGTLIATPEGTRPIEAIRGGDRVTLVGPDGPSTSGTVDSTFQTCNRVVEVRTESGSLLTTETQPLCLQEGGFRRAGELVEGDHIWRWEGGERRAVRVVAVVPTGRETSVFNLVVGDSAVFVAGGFLARGKPPVGDPPSAEPR
jgi:hypothetical protein